MADSCQLVLIDNETYSLFQAPASSTAIVKQSVGKLLGAVDLASLVEDLGKVGMFVKIAYNGVAGNTELQIKVQRIGYEVTELADKSAVTVAHFHSASRDVILELQTCYQYLLDGCEEIALESYTALSNIARKMSVAAHELHEGFRDASEHVKITLEETQLEKGQEEKFLKEQKEKREQYELDRQQAHTDQVAATEAIEKSEKFYQEAKLREEKIINEDRDIGRQFGKALLTIVSFGAYKDNSGKTTEEALKSAQEEKLKNLELLDKHQEARSKALRKLAEMALRIQQCNQSGNLAACTIDALHNAIGGLKELADVMLQAAQFWKQVENHCIEMAEGTLRKNVEKALKYPEEKRKKIWTSNVFKTQAVIEYSRWVALEYICNKYMDGVKATQADLHKYMRENPTIAESRANIKQLAANFAVDLEKAQKKITNERQESRKQQLALEEKVAEGDGQASESAKTDAPK